MSITGRMILRRKVYNKNNNNNNNNNYVKVQMIIEQKGNRENRSQQLT